MNRSPDPQTAIRTASLVRRIRSQSARPRYIWARVRGCSPTATAPPCSQAAAIAGAFLCSSSQPARSLTVTGTGATAATTLRTVRSTSSGSFSIAAPAPWQHTFFTGQPMLMSTASTGPYRSTATRAPAASTSGSSWWPWNSTKNTYSQSCRLDGRDSMRVRFRPRRAKTWSASCSAPAWCRTARMIPVLIAVSAQ